jgi:hypothetical protein
MPFEIQHFPENHLILERFFGIITFDEIREVNRRFLELVEQNEMSVTTLIDLRLVEKYPASIRQIREVLSVSQNPYIGWVVILTNNNPLMKLAASVLTQVSVREVRFRLFEDPLEAVRFIESLHSPAISVIAVSSELSKLLLEA